MKVLPVQILRFVDDSQPGWVECQFSDAAGRRHTFVEKGPVVTTEYLSAESSYPREGILACEVVSAWTDEAGRALSKIDTSRPWDIESKEGLTEFVVLSDALRACA